MSGNDSATLAGASPYWEELWSAGLKPGDRFDAHKSAPILVDLLQKGALPKGKALVPGCGRGYDPITFGLFGYDALGMDLSISAVAEAQKLYEDNAKDIKGTVAFRAGNFFEPMDKKFDVILDYTFLCALNPAGGIREQWAQQMKNLLAPGGMLVTIIFPIVEKEGGPPFQMSIPLVKDLLTPIGFESSRLEMLPDELCHEGREGKTAIGLWSLAK